MNRITVVETIYHQSGDQPPTSLPHKQGVMLETDEMPYARPKTVATEEWSPIDCGWLRGNSGMVSIVNRGGEGKNPEKPRVLEVRLGDSPGSEVWELAPTEGMRGRPKDASKLMVRCQSGATRYSATVFPR